MYVKKLLKVTRFLTRKIPVKRVPKLGSKKGGYFGGVRISTCPGGKKS